MLMCLKRIICVKDALYVTYYFTYICQNFGVDYVKFCEMVEYCPLDFLQLAFKCCQVRNKKKKYDKTRTLV